MAAPFCTKLALSGQREQREERQTQRRGTRDGQIVLLPLTFKAKVRVGFLEGGLTRRAQADAKRFAGSPDADAQGDGMLDHGPLLVSAPPLLAPAKLAQCLKGSRSRRLQEEFPALRKRCWGQPLWARGYF